MAPFRIGSRRTPLALAQTHRVVDDLRARRPEVEVEVVEIVSTGDRDPAAALGPGVFVAELRQALQDGRVDAAVHSLKDLPTADVEGITLVAVPEREDPRDVLVAREGALLDTLPSGARIGTSSPRRAASLVALGLDVEVVPVRGSIGRRLEQLDDAGASADGAPTLDALLLARAGLARLGLLDRVTDVIDPGRILPAAGQGALAVEVRSDDPAALDLLAPLDDPDARAATLAERTVLAVLEAGCTHPIGVLAEPAEGDDGQTELYLRAVVHAHDGTRQVRLSTTGPITRAQQLGEDLAQQLLAAGADALMERQ
jgi:hydroxymethylbilane synthase